MYKGRSWATIAETRKSNHVVATFTKRHEKLKRVVYRKVVVRQQGEERQHGKK